MTPAEAIAALDRQIQKHGQRIRLTRFVKGGAKIERDHVGFVRGYKPSELAGGIMQGDTLIVISPTRLPAEFRGEDNELRAGDRISLRGRIANVQNVVPVMIGDTVVRYEATIRG